MRNFYFRRWSTWSAVVFALSLHASTVSQPILTEAQAKAAFVLNFARYVEWPASGFTSPEAPVVACLVGRDKLGAALLALEGRPVQGRVLNVRRGVAQEDMRACQLVFIDEVEERRVVPILRALAGQPVLTVSDIDRFVDMGGAIGIVLGDDRLQFEVNRMTLERSKLKASSRLLQLARNIP